MTIHRRLMERNLRSCRPLHHLPFTPAHCRARLQWCLARSGGNHADWGRIVLRYESRFRVLTIIEDVCGDTQGGVPMLLSLLHTTQTLYHKLWSGVPFLLTARLLWSSLVVTCSAEISLSPIEHVLDMMGRRLHLSGNADDLARQLE
ncbi:HTH_Tnp_Tc3_2 domain-containing protein [Trichonephila clavipes]|nr:HTH_Tnp_Tc3_2 domain-containing protein [Trichonephila clavipes]